MLPTVPGLMPATDRAPSGLAARNRLITQVPTQMATCGTMNRQVSSPSRSPIKSATEPVSVFRGACSQRWPPRCASSRTSTCATYSASAGTAPRVAQITRSSYRMSARSARRFP